jgi:quercetin dioxygenase-like cupin family protein
MRLGAFAILAVAGCATQATAIRNEPLLGGAQVRSIALTTEETVESLKVRVLVNEPGLKLVSIVLRDGTLLPEHVANVPVTIQAVQGQGFVIAGAERLPIDATHAVVLGPNVAHAVQAEPGTDLVLLVHRSGRAD